MELKGFIRDYGIGTTGDMASGGYGPSRGDPNCHARDLYEATESSEACCNFEFGMLNFELVAG